MLDTIMNRRSTKGYKSDMVPEELINTVVNAGLVAPSGMNTQYGKILVITNKEKRDKLSIINASIMNATKDPFYNAPVVLLVMVKKYRNALYDGSCMMENMLLAAEDLGLGACWIHRAKEELELPEFKELFKDLNINFDEYEGIGHCILGYKDNSYKPKDKPILEDRVVYIK